MLRCDKCGKENKDSAKFCISCGSMIKTATQPAIRPEDTPSTETGNKGHLCIQCGKQNKATAKFCIVCGNKLGSVIQPAPQHIDIPIPETQPNDPVCTQCGKQNKPTAKFCVVCGYNLRFALPELEKHQTNITVKGQSANVENEIHQEKLSDGSDIVIPGILTVEDQNSAIANVPVHENMAEEKNELQDSIPEIEKNYTQYPKKKRKKIILLTISVLVLTGIGTFFLFGNRSGTGTGNPINKQDIQPEEILDTDEGKTSETGDTVTSDSATGKISVIMPPDTLVIKKVAATPLTENLNKPVTVETLVSPTQQMAIDDLNGRKICNDIVFSGNAEVLSYGISKKTNLQCNAIISFRMQNSDINYRVTMIYKKKGSNYIYEDNICYFKEVTGTDKSRVAGTHDVKKDLFNYLNEKKTFCGVQYNSISEINITKVGNGEYYKDSGNTSYLVELSINNLNRKCQVNYTIDGKLYVNPLR